MTMKVEQLANIHRDAIHMALSLILVGRDPKGLEPLEDLLKKITDVDAKLMDSITLKGKASNIESLYTQARNKNEEATKEVEQAKKKAADILDRAAEIKVGNEEHTDRLKEHEKELGEREMGLKQIDESLARRETGIEEREASLAAKHSAVAEQRATLDTDRETFKKAQVQLRQASQIEV